MTEELIKKIKELDSFLKEKGYVAIVQDRRMYNFRSYELFFCSSKPIIDTRAFDDFIWESSPKNKELITARFLFSWRDIYDLDYLLIKLSNKRAETFKETMPPYRRFHKYDTGNSLPETRVDKDNLLYGRVTILYNLGEKEKWHPNIEEKIRKAKEEIEARYIQDIIDRFKNIDLD